MGKSSSKKAPQKASGAKASKVSDTERNSEEYDSCRCCARIWKAEGGLGFDNIQCNSKNMVSAEVAKDILLKLDGEPNEEDVEKFLECYEGSFCKKHLSQDFMMPGGYWLGKVNEKRPEEPMLPTGSIKKGYSEEYKPHQWMYDGNGDKFEKKGRRSSPKKVVDAKPPTDQSDEEVEEKVNEEVEEKVEEEVNEEVKEDVKQMEEFLAWKAGKKENEQKKVAEGEVVVEENEEEVVVEEKEEEVSNEAKVDGPLDVDISKESSDEEEFEDSEYIVDGVEYIKHWDEDEKEWIILETEEYSKVGTPIEGGIEWDNEDEERKHEAKA